MINTGRSMRYLITIVTLVSIITLPSCGRKQRTASSEIKVTWKVYDTPPGADPSVPDSLGGNGFEKIAADLGYTTYEPTQDEMKYFGDPRAKKGGSITLAESQFPNTFRPVGQGSNITTISEMSGLVYETLLSTHPITREYIPSLATHWKVGEDKKTYTFRLDPNARFSDGKPVTSEDVVATWKLLMDPSILEPSMQLVFGKFEEPVAISKYIVEVKSKTVNFRDLLYFGASLLILPAHEISKLTGTEFLEKFNFNMPVGTGPYIILEKDIKPGASWKCTRRPDYWAIQYPTAKNYSNFDFINYIVVKDNMRLLYEKFKTGETDLYRFNMLSTEWLINDTTYDALKNGWVRRCRVFTNGPMGTQGITFNMRKQPFSDKRVRQAFIMAYPRETLIEKLLYGEYEAYDTYYPNTVYANPSNPPVKFDPQQASKLLAEAGWTSRDQNGILVKNGQPFVVELPITKDSERWITPYQQELKKIGVDLRLKFMDWNSLIKAVDERNFTIFLYGYSGLLTPNPETSLMSSLADKNNNNNIQGFKNARVDELLKEYDSTYSVQRQIKIIQEIDGIAYNEYMSSFWWNPKGIRFAYWDKFGMPEYGLSRYAQLGYLYGTIVSSWWYEPEKAEALKEAMKNKKDLGGDKSIRTIDYWRKFTN
ncbi:MAG: ABC transporter substrate-binding protein [Flavobacteriales bacterium]|nr:MAG: peptide/nickel transport system substrate-binding protein [Chlorobi bacterium OLB6]MBE2265538.1 ABC transporter substrate-binding protein [Flavobacteriales bacterium]MBV6463250.1 hypothetical protein [Chlorobiota bacterium]MBW7853057.1 ABC transporter substrate-binding protein [Candidatus Kapabacteria bacterium]MCC6331454.1 ABC transporter substrate-binding protein [Ignavibacteria bacterium]